MRTRLGEHLNLKDEDYIISHWEIPGYCLTHKRWSHFGVDGIKDIVFKTAVFDSLVLPKNKKDLISSLVKAQEIQTSPFDDLIAGKGRGLIFLLHGPPGVGKTLTAGRIYLLKSVPWFTLTDWNVPQRVLRNTQSGHCITLAAQNLAARLQWWNSH